MTCNSSLKHAIENFFESNQEFLNIMKPIEYCMISMSVFGNIFICLVIVSNKNMRTPMNCYLFNLSVCDAIISFLAVNPLFLDDTIDLGSILRYNY